MDKIETGKTYRGQGTNRSGRRTVEIIFNYGRQQWVVYVTDCAWWWICSLARFEEWAERESSPLKLTSDSDNQYRRMWTAGCPYDFFD